MKVKNGRIQLFHKCFIEEASLFIQLINGGFNAKPLIFHFARMLLCKGTTNQKEYTSLKLER